MDIILNYIFVGFAFTFLIDLLLNSEKIKNHRMMKNSPTWNMELRIICVLIWPLCALVFLYSFFKTYFK